MKLKRFTTQLVAAGLIAMPLMAHAAGLGKMSVTSALGQPLAAEIEVFAADKAELDSLSATLASDQAFRDARVDYAPVLSSLRFSIEKKASGKAFLKVTSSRPVNDPFIDMLIELSWASGRLVREYTMLLDPPGMVVPQAVAPKPPVVAAPVIKPAPAPAPAPAVEKPAAASKPEIAQADKPKPAPVPRSAGTDSVTVKRGDTLISVARQVRPEGVSLEQTLVGLYRDNSKAFDGNMNRLKAGARLKVPTADKAAAIPQAEAAREIRLQADDWRAYRQKLAEAVVAAPEAKPAADQAASSGKVAPKVEDRAKPAPAAQKDVLKLSKGSQTAAPSSAAAKQAREEDAIAGKKAAQESGQRVAVLEKQIDDLQKLADMKEKALAKPPAAANPAPETAAPAVPVPTIEAAAPEAPQPATPAKPVPAPAVKAPPVVPEATGNWYDPLIANPMYWGGALAAIGLGGVLWWMVAGGGRRRKTAAAAAIDDSIMSGGDIHPNTVVGAASGGSVNTGDTSFLTDFSQAGLGTIDTHDVDPIAEAEVYMAYGRDAQAEEILKEAISKNPDRPEIRVKLLEIYASRRNTKAFESTAGELYAALGSKPSPLWDKACEMGRSIDPTNPLYGGVQASQAPAAETVAATAAIAGGAVGFAEPAQAAPTPAASGPDATTPLEFESAGSVLSFDAPAAATPDAGYVEMDTQGLDFDLPDLDIPTGKDDDALKLDLGMEDDNNPDSKFDFSGLDLDLGDAGGNDLELDEVGTKLDLARAYVEMGDKEGAREILSEVLAEGNEKQKSDAKSVMSTLG